MSKHTYSTANLSDRDLKEQGNRLFSHRKYEDAVSCYSKAIEEECNVVMEYLVNTVVSAEENDTVDRNLVNTVSGMLNKIKNPSIPTYFTNRALCYLKLKRFELTCNDCRRALDMDANLVKGHFFMGQALFELDAYDEAVKHLQRALDLAKEQKMNFGDDIASLLRAARKKRWNTAEERRIAQEIELLSYLNRLIVEDTQKKIDLVKRESGTDGTDEFSQSKIKEFENKCVTYTSELNSLFAKNDDRRKKRDVPDYLCGKISFEILREPVITPSGITYERKEIEEHLQRVGHFDPVTRVKLTQDQLIPNFAMKDVVDTFIQENEWALDY